MTRTEAVAEIHRLLTKAAENHWMWITISPELQAAANDLPEMSWKEPANFSISVIQQWVEEVERRIAAETARTLTR